jgi:hypothetical protein
MTHQHNQQHTAQHSTTLHGTVQYSTAQHCASLCSVLFCCVVLCSVPLSSVLTAMLYFALVNTVLHRQTPSSCVLRHHAPMHQPLCTDLHCIVLTCIRLYYTRLRYAVPSCRALFYSPADFTTPSRTVPCVVKCCTSAFLNSTALR